MPRGNRLHTRAALGSFLTKRLPIKTGRRQGVTPGGSPVPEMPASFRAAYPAATKPEWAIYWAHGRLGLEEGTDFTYQYPVGMIGAKSSRIDFLERDIWLAVEVQGTFAHYGLEGAVTNDLDRRVNLESLGFQVIFIDERSANTDPVFYLREARRGREYSVFATAS